MDREENRDGRRRAGSSTRMRLLDATMSLIANEGEANVSLRDITDAANANVAAVSYHFGSKDNLRREAIDGAIRTVVASHLSDLETLPNDADAGQIGAVLGATLIKRLTSKDARERVTLRLSAQTILTNAQSTSYTQTTAALFDHLYNRLRVILPHTPAKELRFRAESAAKLLQLVAAGALDAHVHNLTPTHLAKLLVPVISGCLAGWTDNTSSRRQR